MLAHENYYSAFWTLWAGGSLKKSQMGMPKAGPDKPSKSNAILPGAAYSAQEEEAAPDHEEEDDE